MRHWISIGLLAILTIGGSACRSTGRAASNNLQPCEVALAMHNGDGQLDREIRQLQHKIRVSPQPLPLIEKLGWSFVEKARVSFDSGYYKLAEQCAVCLEAKQAEEIDQGQKPSSTGSTLNSQSGQSTKSASLLLRGHALHNLHRFAEAEQLARELTRIRGLAFDYGLLGDVLMEQGKLDDAIQAYQRMMELKPGPQAYSRAAHVHWIKGDLKGARLLMQMAAQAFGQAGSGDAESAAWAWSKLAIYELQAGNLKKADQICELALQIQPEYAPALLARGRILMTENKFTEAAAIIELAEKLNPLPEYRWALAEALRAAGDEAKAETVETELAARAVSDDPRTFSIYLSTRGEQTAKAFKLAEDELQHRRDVFTLDALAWAQLAVGKNSEAWQTMQSALATGTQDARLFMHAAVIAAKANQTAEAQGYFKRVSALQSTLLPSEKERLRQLKL
ncbi:MAG: tetratricopeptide repeat protein [Blastocatellales bacterium]